MRLFASISLILLLLVGMVQADPSYNIQTYDVARTTSSTRAYDPLSHFRFQIAPTSRAGQVVLYMANSHPTTSTTFYMTNDLDAGSPWTVQLTESPTYLAHNHGHLSIYNDTIYWGVSAGNMVRAYYAGASSLTHLFSYTSNFTTDADQYILSVARIPGTDTVILISRGTTEPGNTNILWWRSDDKGVTFDSMGLAVDYTAVGSDVRLGLTEYAGSILMVTDTAHTGIVSTGPRLRLFNRTTQVWDSILSPIVTSSGGYRSFGASVHRDTTLFAWHAKDNIGAGLNDSAIIARKNDGASTWERQAWLMGTGTISGVAPYQAMTYIEATQRTVYFQNYHTGSTVDLFMRYYRNADSTWSDTIRLTNNGLTWKFSTAQVVPASHGDVAYLAYNMDTTISGTHYYYSKMVRISFTENSDTTVIDTLPWVIRDVDDSTTFIFGSHLLESDSIGIYFESGAHDIIIDGQGDTLRWGKAGLPGSGLTLQPDGVSYEISSDAGGRDQWGISFRQAANYNVQLRNIVFDHGIPDTLADSATFPTVGCAIRGGNGTVNLTVENCDITVKGRNSKLMYVDNSGDCSYNIYLKNNIFRDEMHSFRRRDQWNRQAGITFFKTNSTAERYGIDFQYHLKIEGCSTAVAYWTQLHLQGDSTVADIVNNYWETDGWNLLQDRVNDIYDNCTENYCIALRQDADTNLVGGHRIKVRNNRFRNGTAHAGGRGIFISGVDGPNYNYEDSCVAIIDNDIRTHGGPDGYVSFHDAVRIRDDWSNVRFTGNYIQNVGYTTPPNGSYSDGPHGVIRLTENTGTNFYFKRNTVVGYMADAFTFDEWNGEAGVGVSLFVTDECDNQSANIYVDSNTFYSNNVFFDMGFGNGQGGNFTSLIGNTFAFYNGTSSNNSNQWTWYAGTAWHNTVNSFYNYLQDCIFDSSVSPTHVTVSNAQSDSLHFGLKSTVTVTVLDGSAVPVSGATVTVTNDYGNQIASGTTNGAGQYSAVLKHYDNFNTAWGAGVTDSAGFNPFVFHAELGADTDDSTYAVDWNAKTITLTLGATVAPPTPPLVKIKGGWKIKNNVWIGKNRDHGSGYIDPEPPQP